MASKSNGNGNGAPATVFGWSYNRFHQHFAVMGGYQNDQVVDYDNLDELNRKFYSVGYPPSEPLHQPACGVDVEGHQRLRHIHDRRLPVRRPRPQH